MERGEAMELFGRGAVEALRGTPPGPPGGPRRPTFLHHVVTRVEAVGLYLLVGFFLSGVLVVLFGLLAHEVFGTARANPLDREITLAVRPLQTPELVEAARSITFFGGALFLLPATVLVAAGLREKGHWVSALLFCGSVAGGFGLNSLLKIAFTRARPDLWPALVSEKTYSFPSGHAAMSTVFYGGIAAVVFHLSARRGPRLTAVFFATIAIGVIAASRVFLGAHWTTDVVAGMLVGLFWLVVSAIGTEWVYRRVPDVRPRRRRDAGPPRSPAP